MGWRGVSEIESEVQEQKKQKTPVLIVIWTWTQHFTDAEQNKWLCTVQQLSLTSFHTHIITEYEWEDLMKQMHTGVSTHFVFRMFIFQMWHRGIFEESDFIKKFRLCLCVCVQWMAMAWSSWPSSWACYCWASWAESCTSFVRRGWSAVDAQASRRCEWHLCLFCDKKGLSCLVIRSRIRNSSTAALR